MTFFYLGDYKLIKAKKFIDSIHPENTHDKVINNDI